MTTKDITIRHHNRNISGRLYLPQMDKCPMVILSHGFNGSGDDFTEYAKVLVGNKIGACTFDFCGGSLRSKSDLSTTEMTVFTEKEDLLAVIDFAEHLIPAVWEENITGLFSNPIYIPRHPFYLKRLMTDIANEYKKNDSFSADIIRCRLTEILAYLLRNPSLPIPQKTDISHPNIVKLTDYINNNFNKQLTLEYRKTSRLS